MDALTLGAIYGVYNDGVMSATAPVFSRNHEVESFGVSAAYDLGGGLSAHAGYSNTDVRTAAGVTTDADRFTLGLAMSF
jgi:predicted porin